MIICLYALVTLPNWTYFQWNLSARVSIRKSELSQPLFTVARRYFNNGLLPLRGGRVGKMVLGFSGGWIKVGQRPTVLAADAAGVVCLPLLSPLMFLFALSF